MPYFEETIELRDEVRGALADLVGAEPDQVALTSLDERRLRDRARGASARAGRRDRHDDRRALRPAGAARCVTGRGRRRARPTPSAILAAVTPRTRLIATSQVLWTTGAMLPLAELRRTTRRSRARRRRAVGRRDPDHRGRPRLPHRSPVRSGSAGRTPPARSSSPTPSSSRSSSPSYLAQTPPRAGRDLRAAPGRAPVRARLVVAGRARGAARRARAPSRRGRTSAPPRPRRAAASSSGRASSWSSPVAATLVAFRPEETPAEVVERLHEADVHVRELPGRGLVRASCGWWTSDDDLERLVAALRLRAGIRQERTPAADPRLRRGTSLKAPAVAVATAFSRPRRRRRRCGARARARSAAAPRSRSRCARRAPDRAARRPRRPRRGGRRPRTTAA